MKKEPFFASIRTRLAVAAIVTQLLALAIDAYQLPISPELTHEVANFITGVLVSLIVGRSMRNTQV